MSTDFTHWTFKGPVLRRTLCDHFLNCQVSQLHKDGFKSYKADIENKSSRNHRSSDNLSLIISIPLGRAFNSGLLV